MFSYNYGHDLSMIAFHLLKVCMPISEFFLNYQTKGLILRTRPLPFAALDESHHQHTEEGSWHSGRAFVIQECAKLGDAQQFIV